MDSLSEFDSMSESSSSEEDIEFYGGQARTIFSSLEESIEKIDDFLLFERGFSHNDIVRLASHPSGQMGKVINVDMSVDLEDIYGCKIKNINTRYIQKMRSVSVTDYISLGPWLGKVEKIVDCLTILFDDGTKCQVSAEGPEKVIPVSPDLVDDPQYPFYPGQRVKIESSASRSTRWLCGIKKDKKEQGTVCSVDACSVYVDWLSCAIIGGEKGPSPPCLQDTKRISLLPYFPDANWQLGDWCVVAMEPSFPCVRFSGLAEGHEQSDILFETQRLGPNFQQFAVIAKIKTKIDIQWQDGSQSLGLDPCLLCPVNIIDAHDFWPDSFVLEKGTADDSQTPGLKKWGVVKSVDPKERTVKVQWCHSSQDQFCSEKEQTEEIVSAYELVEHPDYSYYVGDAVFRPRESLVEIADENCDTNYSTSKIFKGEEADPMGNVNDDDQNEHLNSHIPYFGTVVGLKHGQVEVKWTTGTTTKVAPHEIYRVEKCESTTDTVFGDENVQQPDEELQLKNQMMDQKLTSEVDLNHDSAEDSVFRSISQVALGVFATITSSVFGSLPTSLTGGYQRVSEDAHIPGQFPVGEALELCNLNPDVPLPAVDDLDMPDNLTQPMIKETEKNVVLPSSSNQPESFRQFDMVNDCSDHHFVNECGMDIQSPQMKRCWLKKVHQEWNILENDLPEMIYVRVYEERMDLLQAAIAGSAGTPYHDGLFFFDIYLPPQYPNEPPMVYYNSGGLRINPNLYESGKVCLSLLNTWSGSQSEVWNPDSSTILQVLLSLQALVLNETPYFNEAGYDSQIGTVEGQTNSFGYNENAFLLNCKSMLYLLRKPPRNFKTLVEEHFSRRCGSILLACEAYMEGAPIGHPFDHGEEIQQQGNSTGFKLMLTKLYPRLVEAFPGREFDAATL